MLFHKVRIVHNDHDVPYGLVCRALRKIDSAAVSGQNIIDFDRVVGYSNLVEVGDDDEFYEEIRGNRQYASRFVKNKLPVPCRKLAVVWRRSTEDEILVITAYFTNEENYFSPDEPGNIIRKVNKGIAFTPEQIQESIDFWSRHAFVEPIPINY